MTTPISQEPENREPVWKYRGYELRPSEFNTAMVHFYRAEIQRCNVWRSRLDATTNWAVITTGTAISFSLTNPNNHYGVIILNSLLILFFLWIEARRYRYYELWSLRTRLLETDFFAAMLVPPFAPSNDWAESLAQSLLQPEYPIGMAEALGRRLRRNYLYIFIVLGFASALKAFLHPEQATSWPEFISRFALGNVSGETMLMIGLVFYAGLGLFALLTARLTQASGEVLPKFGVEQSNKGVPLGVDKPTPTIPGLRHRRQLLTWVVTTQPQTILKRVLADMKRGATVLQGQGGFSRQEQSVLMVALTVTEIAELKAIVKEEDPNAFVVVTQAQEVLGKGFQKNKGTS